jgi:hypothetical protein
VITVPTITLEGDANGAPDAERLGDRFDADKLKAYSSGSVIVLPGNTWPSTEQSRANTSRK